MTFSEQQKEELGFIVRLVVSDPRWTRMSIPPERAKTEAWAILRAKERQLRDFNAARYAFARNALRILEDELERKMRTAPENIERCESDKRLIGAAIDHVFGTENNARNMLRALFIDGTTLKHWVRKHGRDGRSMDAHYKEIQRNKQKLLEECLDEHKATVRQMMEMRSRKRSRS